MVVPEPKTFDKGLAFVKDTDILLSGDKWTIVVNIALDDCDALAYTMNMTLNEIHQKIRTQRNPKSYSFDIHWDEINHLDAMIQGLDTDLQGFRKLLFEGTLTRSPSTTDARAKRGLISLLGYGMKYLFGTAEMRKM
jgi:hypothetical protein